MYPGILICFVFISEVISELSIMNNETMVDGACDDSVIQIPPGWYDKIRQKLKSADGNRVLRLKINMPKENKECQVRVKFLRDRQDIDIANCDMGESVDALFNEFVERYGKMYTTSKEHERRRKIFQENLIRNEILKSAEKGSASYDVTMFSDLTPGEITRRTGYKQEPFENVLEKNLETIEDVNASATLDWRQRNVVGPVRHQVFCSSCWAIAPVLNVESLNAIQTGVLTPLSEQQIIDCDDRGEGCSASSIKHAYNYMKRNLVTSRSSYPYEDVKNMCRFRPYSGFVGVRKTFSLPKNEELIKKFIYKYGPVVVTFNANTLQFYKKGVLRQDGVMCNRKELSHAGLAVGYGVEKSDSGEDLPYWLVMNSWGPMWGDNGYFKIYRGAHVCGIGRVTVTAALRKPQKPTPTYYSRPTPSGWPVSNTMFSWPVWNPYQK